MALIKRYVIFFLSLLFINILLFGATQSSASNKLKIQTTCYAEYDSNVYIDGDCTLYFDKNDPYWFTLSHKLECDDEYDNCGYHFKIYKYDDLDIWSVNFSSDFDKRSQKLQEYLGDQFKIKITKENNQYQFCAVDQKSNFCFIVPKKLNNQVIFKTINQKG